tara:strand:+ start:68 stop:547 length:480 start_codon:yes stop_codon:yes gene_type:complete
MLRVSMFLTSFKLNDKFTNTIKAEILGLKNNWKKDLNNVKSLTSGFKPNYIFFDILKEQLSEKIFSITKIKCKATWWWANYYNIGHYANLHAHEPEHISSIIFIKTDKTNPLYFNLDPGILRVQEEEGLVLLFDSKLQHGVDPCKQERITLAVDFINDI